MDDRYLRIDELRGKPGNLPMSRATIYRMIKKGEFPAPIKMGKASVWPQSEIHQWVEDQKLRRAGGPPNQN